jgi:hypothetical protein
MAKWIATSVKQTTDAIDQTTVIQLMEPYGWKKRQNDQRDGHEALSGDTFARPANFTRRGP